jgi:uncharacterized protein
VNPSLPPSKSIAIYIDADAGPVKQKVYRVAERHALKGTALKVFVVTNSPIAVPRDPLIERVVRRRLKLTIVPLWGMMP